MRDLPLIYRDQIRLPATFEYPSEFEGLSFDQYDRDKIARIGGSTLLKFYTDDGLVREQDETDVETIIDTASLHTDKLASLGMNVAPHMRSIGIHPTLPNIVVYTLATEIIGQELSCDYADKNPESVYKQVIEPLLAYYNWVLDSGQFQFICDLSVSYQYVVGHPATSSDQSERIWLVDLDPFITSTRQSMHGEICELDGLLSLVGIKEGQSTQYNELYSKWDKLSGRRHLS